MFKITRIRISCVDLFFFIRADLKAFVFQEQNGGGASTRTRSWNKETRGGQNQTDAERLGW